MQTARWAFLGILASLLTGPRATAVEPKARTAPPIDATIRILEGNVNEVHVTVARFELTRQLAWRTNGEETTYLGPAESVLRTTLRADGPQAGLDLAAWLARAAEEDPTLARPPLVAFTMRAIAFRGVVHTFAARCDEKACEVDLTLGQAQHAVARGTNEDMARSPGF